MILLCGRNLKNPKVSTGRKKSGGGGGNVVKWRRHKQIRRG